MGPLLGGALAFRQWIETGHGRVPLRGALVRLWCEDGLLRTPLPLTGAAAFRSGTSWTARNWVPAWLSAIGDEAEAIRAMARALEASWRQARLQAGDQRRNSRASAAIDVIAAHPVISATSLAARLSMSIKAACLLLERFLERGLIVEVTHRSARRLFALRDMEPLQEVVQPRQKTIPGRKRGTPRATGMPEVPPVEDSSVQRDFQPLERWAPDYSELEAAMAEVDLLCRRSQA
ncbi:hypothetical protein [Acetobacter okinawensis]|uniref:hypothetical protein n=3 Tax=Acetobacter okinawensis TaxID=1076594 RepID=UPI000470A280|nr:hypothetical protein [Acetobacter okinawensis]